MRFAVAKRIVERAADHGIPREDVIVDPLLMPIGALPTAGRQVFRILGRLRDELGVNSTVRREQRQLRAAEPRGHQRRVPADGHRERADLGDHEPARRGVRQAVMAADVLMGNDRDASRWIRQFRVAPPGGRERRPAGEPPTWRRRGRGGRSATTG